MSFTDSVRHCLRNYVTFEGRATRSEFWWFYLFTCIVGLVALLPLLVLVPLAIVTWGSDGSPASVTFIVLSALWGLLYLLISVALLIPRIAAGSRRLHDLDQSAWFLLLLLVPGGDLVLLVFWVMEGTQGYNKFGPPPGVSG